MATQLRYVDYARQSRQREDESDASPQTQHEANHAMASARGWTRAGSFEDVGASGWDPRADRPGFRSLLAAVERGEADVVVIYMLSRLTRQGVAEAVRIVGLLRENGARLVSVQEPFLDTSTPMGEGIFALFAAMAQQDVATMRNYVIPAKDRLRRQGAWLGGKVPYGFQTASAESGGLRFQTLVRREDEATVLEECARRLLEGESTSSVCRDLNERGVSTYAREQKNGKASAGAYWTPSNLPTKLLDPRVRGYSTHYGEVVRDEEGLPIAAWEPVLSAADYYALKELFGKRKRGRLGPNPTLLGTAMLCHCDRCGARMNFDKSKPKARPTAKPVYRCAAGASSTVKGCGGVSVSAAEADDYVSRAVWRRLAALDPADEGDAELLAEATRRHAAREEDPALVASRREAEAEIETATSALYRLDDDRASGVFDGPAGDARYRRQAEALNGRLRDAQARASALPKASGDLTPFLDVAQTAETPDSDPIGEGSVWASWSVRERREFLALFLDDVRIMPRPKGVGPRSPWDGSQRIRLVWAGSGD